MPIPELNISTTQVGLPRQEVPLRYAVLVTGLSAQTVMTMITNAFDLGESLVTSLLDCYEYSGGKIRKCNSSSIGKLLNGLQKLNSEKARMKLLPSSWFVYSDDLAAAFSNWVDLTMDRESASNSGMGLNWDPALYPFENEIKGCSILPASKSSLTLRERRKQATAQKHNSWYKEFSEIKKLNPTFTDSHIARSVAKKFNADKHTIRRVISDLK